MGGGGGETENPKVQDRRTRPLRSRDLRRRNFSASLPIIVSSIDRTPQFLPTGSRPAAKSVCGRENIDVYRDADGRRRCPDANLIYRRCAPLTVRRAVHRCRFFVFRHPVVLYAAGKAHRRVLNSYDEYHGRLISVSWFKSTDVTGIVKGLMMIGNGNVVGMRGRRWSLT